MTEGALIPAPTTGLADAAVLDQLTTLRQAIAPGLTDQELLLFALVAQRHRLDPFAGQIRAVKRNTKQGPRVSFQTGIDGYRSIAQGTGEYLGSDDATFGPPCACGQEPKGHPEFATVRVYRRGGRPDGQPGTVYWHELKPEDDFMWRRMPRGMLAKCAEALALRKAFPQVLGDLYTDDEMAQADDARDQAPAPTRLSPREIVAARAAALEAAPSESPQDDENMAGGPVSVQPPPAAPGGSTGALVEPGEEFEEPDLDPAEVLPEPMTARQFQAAITAAAISKEQARAASARLFPDRAAASLDEREWGELFADLMARTVQP